MIHNPRVRRRRYYWNQQRTSKAILEPFNFESQKRKRYIRECVEGKDGLEMAFNCVEVIHVVREVRHVKGYFS